MSGDFTLLAVLHLHLVSSVVQEAGHQGTDCSHAESSSMIMPYAIKLLLPLDLIDGYDV